MSKKKDDTNYELESLKATVNIQKLERQLITLAKENQQLKQQITTAESRLAENEANIDIERADRFDLTSDMNRQFQQMQEDLLKEIAEREKNIEANRIQNQKEQEQLQQVLQERIEVLGLREADIQQLKLRLDQLSREFSAILRETLAQIAEKIESKTDEVLV